MRPEEERALALEFAERIATLFNDIELGDHHWVIVTVDEESGRVFLEGKYGRQAEVIDTYGFGWKVEG